MTEDEIEAVITCEFANKKLAYIRDLFVFASFTALSFVDIKALTTYDIVEINGEKLILSKRHKTKVNFQMKLLDIPLQIIKRYERFQEDKLVFPNLSYWNICKPLKKMIKECGISKDISFHCTRHGFAALALSKGVPIESVSRVFGHTNITTTQKYAKSTTYNLEVVIALAFRLNACEASRIRQKVLESLCQRKESGIDFLILLDNNSHLFSTKY